MEEKKNKFLIKSYKQMFMVIGIFTLVLLVGGTTYAFFNYTRTGSANTVRVGRIYFNHTQDGKINLTNAFPITVTKDANDHITNETGFDTVEINIEGDTDYVDGVEYLVSSTNTNITTSNGTLVPISLDITATNLGTENANYFTARESKDTTMYKKLVGGTLVGDQMLLIGYIKPNTTSGTAEGIQNGKLTIKAYLDDSNILVSDTYDGTESDNMGTPNSLAQGKTVLTTEEWNNLSSTGISFQIKVEANEGIWVKGSLEEIMKQKNFDSTKNRGILDNEQSDFVTASTGIDFGAVSSDTNGKGVYMRAGTENDAYPILYYRGAVEDNNVVFNNKCWKAVRTTDTGGVKLIYNGESSNAYGSGATISRASYTNVTTPLSAFTFDTTDNSWNTTIVSVENQEIAFTLHSGSNYAINVTGTTSSQNGGTFSVYKDNSSIYSQGFGSGNPISISYTLGTVTSDNVIKLYVGVGGNVNQESPITVKIKVEQDGIAIAQSNYKVLSESFTYDEITQKWSSTVEQNKRATIEFNVNVAGDYFINYTNPNGGPFYVFKNGTVISTASGTQNVKLFNLQTTDKIVVEYAQYASGSGVVEFYITEAENIGLVCENNGSNTHIDVNGSKYIQFSGNNLQNSLAYLGYMWGTVYESSRVNWKSGAKFGSGFTWDGTNYKLTDAVVTTPNDTHHYSCNSTDAEATCTSIRYVYWVNGSDKYYITISGGKGIEEAIKDMQTNTTPSNAKTQIDSWYASNMNTVTNKLEDTIWCNDRSIGKYNGWSATGTINGSSSDYKNHSLLFGAHERSNNASGTSTVKNRPSLACANKNDAFTVSNGNGNQKLTYPVALLTEDEMVLAGGIAGMRNESFYLYNGSAYYWSMSPSYFYNTSVREYIVYYGAIDFYDVTTNTGLRPSVSLKPGLSIIKGTGTATDPYVIE